MKKKEFWPFNSEHAVNNELELRKIKTIIPYTDKWTKGSEDENDTANVTLHFDDGDVKVEAIRSNGNDILLLESWEEVKC
ncbi:hypothetical protein CN918_29990 [Priestia megaterium]|nr:hypothetical protein CN918_29990 [Priestia megaterium]